VTERIVIASKGRFDRALKPDQRLARGLPSTGTISRDEFLEATTDLWEMPTESATRVGHPAPYPVELPKRLTELYTYEDDVVLDPFMGSGTTAIAALRTRRHYIGFETDRSYVTRANQRIAEEKKQLLRREDLGAPTFRVSLPALRSTDQDIDFPTHAVQEGRQAKDFARLLLESCGFVDIRADVKLPRLGIELSFLALDKTKREWAFDVSGAFSSSRAGLKRADILWKTLGKAAVLHQGRKDLPLILLTTDAPARGTAGLAALQALRGPGRQVFDLVELLETKDHERLRKYALKGLPK
jgi:site-specific DNA-methyltransferase (adenine-specific)